MTQLNPNLLMIIFPLFFLIFFLLSFNLIQYLIRRRVQKEIVSKIQSGGDDMVKHIEEQKKESPGSLTRFFSLFSKDGKAGGPDGDVKNIKFLKAGLHSPHIKTAFTGAKMFLPLFFIALFAVLRVLVFKVMSDPVTIACLVGLGLFGFYLPDIWLKQRTDKRKERLFKGLPDALDLLVVCVEAGMGMDGAILRVSEETRKSYPDISSEFALMNLELRAGKSRQNALRNLALRSDINEMNSLVTLLIQTDKFGTSVAAALRVFAESFRTKRFNIAEEKAAKLPVKILIPLVFFIFPALFVVIIGPAAISIVRNLFTALAK